MTSYIPSSADETKEMLAFLGKEDIYDLMQLPQALVLNRPLQLPEATDERTLTEAAKRLGAKNRQYRTVLRGAGAYRHFIPAAVDFIASQNEFVTAYTPYQAEMSQGILCAIFEYQTHLCNLTGLDVSNASLYDGAYAAAEAVMMCKNPKRKKALICGGVHPHTSDTVRTYCSPAGFDFVNIPQKDGRVDVFALQAELSADAACVLIQSPNYLGLVEDTAALGQIIKPSGAKYILSQNPLSMALYTTPAEAGADIALGDAQPLGLPLSFGGPYIGFLCATQALVRSMGGRIVGQTTDHEGRRAFVLTLQAREQHIRREGAKSAICSNQALCALRVSAYLAAMGPQGLTDTALLCRANAAYLKQQLAATGVFQPRFSGEHFHEFATDIPQNYAAIEAAFKANGIQGPLPIEYAGEKLLLWCATELIEKETADAIAAIAKEAAV
jgi:glycine dehydrogenase subunit 1